MQKKVLITGGTHPLGIYLAKTYLKKNHPVTLFDSEPLPRGELKGAVQLVQGDITKPTSLTEAVKGQEIVIHAQEATELSHKKKNLYKINVTGTENLLKACQAEKIEKLVLLSTTDVYGAPDQTPHHEDSPLNPIGHYSISKVMAERLCQHYGDQGVPFTILRTRPVVGPTLLQNFVLWFEALYNGRRLFILGNGKNKYQLLALSDLCEAVYKASLSSLTNQVFNLGAKDYQPLRKDLQALIRFDKASSRITSFPVHVMSPLLGLLHVLKLSPFSKRYYLTFSRPSSTSIAKAEKLLSWSPQKSNKELLLESYLWYKKNRKKILKEHESRNHAHWNFELFELLSRF